MIGRPGRGILGWLAAAALTACSQGLPPWLGLGRGGPGDTASALDGATQTTPLIVGTVVDAFGQPVRGARVRIFEGLALRLDGVTQTTPLDGVTQTTPLDGVTQTTPLDGVTQTTPFDGVTQTTPLQASGETGPDGRFAIPAPGRRVLAVEAKSGGLLSLRPGVVAAAGHARVDVGALALDRPGVAAGRVVGPPPEELAGIAVFVPGTDYLTRTDAAGVYTLGGLPAGTLRVAAIKPRFRPAVAGSVAIRPGATASVPDLPLIPEKPRLTRLDPSAAGPGAEVRLDGEDFGASDLAPVTVRFGALQTTQATRVEAGAIVAVVPAGATSGPVTVLVDGVPSNALDFAVIASLSFTPAATRSLPGIPVALTLDAFDGAGQAIVGAAASWSVDPPDLGQLADGTFVASRDGYGRVVARSGNLAAAADLGFGSWRATAILGDGQPRQGALTGSSASVSLRYPSGLALDPAGGLLFTDLDTRSLDDGFEAAPALRRLGSDGMVTLVAGTGEPGYDGEGLAIGASRLSRAVMPAFGPGGALAFIDRSRVRGWLPADGTLLGRSLSAGKLWDLATASQDLAAVAWGPDGDVYVTERVPHGASISRLGAGGTRTPVVTAGPDIYPETQATQADPAQIQANLGPIALDAAGNLFIGAGTRVWLLCRKAGTYFGVPALPGQLVAVAGTGRYAAGPDEGPGLTSSLWSVSALAFAGNDLLIVERSANRVRVLEPTGRLRTMAGGGPTGAGLAVDLVLQDQARAMPSSGLAQDLWLSQPTSIAVDPDGSVYVTDRLNHRLLKLFK